MARASASKPEKSKPLVLRALEVPPYLPWSVRNFTNFSRSGAPLTDREFVDVLKCKLASFQSRMDTYIRNVEWLTYIESFC